MKTDLNHLPTSKQQELTETIHIIRQHPAVEMIILFGSYARGDWREELADDGVHFIKQSDFDLLLIVETRSKKQQARLEIDIGEAIEQAHWLKTPISVIVHDIELVNHQLTQTQYFFSDIKKQGILLYDSGKFKLAKPRKLHPMDRYLLAKEDYKHWFSGAVRYFDTFQIKLDKQYYSDAAFELHQVTERLYSTILLVFTRYKPNTHSLKILRILVNSLDSRFTEAFPLTNSQEKHHFKLLYYAYVEARYKPSYSITKEELLWLSEQVQRLMTLANVLCEEKIKSFAQAAGKGVEDK